MLVRPISWSTNISGYYDSVAYTESGKLCLLRVASGATQIVKFNSEPTTNEVQNLISYTKPLSYSYSQVDPASIILRSPATRIVSQTGWTVKTDPIDSLTSYFRASPYRPYSWLRIKQFSVPKEAKIGRVDLDMVTSEQDIEEATLTSLPKRKVMFLAVEPFGNNEIRLISAVISRDGGIKSYIWSRQAITVESDEYLYTKRCTSEQDLIYSFFALWQSEKPDSIVTYDGDCYEFQLLSNRISSLGLHLPSLSRVREREASLTEDGLSVPGVEVIDLLHFVQRFYPDCYDLKLSTVASYYLGEIIDRNVEDDEQCIQQLWIMERLYRVLNVESILEEKANNWRTSINNVLRKSNDELVEILAHRVDPSSTFLVGCSSQMSQVANGERGFYSNVYSYDYSSLYQQLMTMTADYLTVNIGRLLADGPPSLLATAYFSKYIKRSLFSKYFDQLLAVAQVIEITPTEIRCLKIVKSNFLRLANINPIYAILDASSRIIYDSDGVGYSSLTGTDPLVTANFPLATDMILTYAGNLVLNAELPPITLEQYPYSKFIMTLQVRPASEEAPGSDSALLALQYPGPILTSVRVQYVRTTIGPVLLHLFKPDVHKLDYPYYTQRLNSYIQQLLEVPLYK